KDKGDRDTEGVGGECGAGVDVVVEGVYGVGGGELFDRFAAGVLFSAWVVDEIRVSNLDRGGCVCYGRGHGTGDHRCYDKFSGREGGGGQSGEGAPERVAPDPL